MKQRDKNAALSAWIHLNAFPAVGAVTFHRLVRAFGSPEAVLKAGAAEVLKKTGLDKAAWARIVDGFSQDDLAVELRRLEEMGLQVVTFRDPLYPPNLLACYDPPPLLYVKGTLKADERRSVAVVGTRKPTEYGIRQAGVLAGGLAARGICVVSGLARGIDTLAHRAALQAGGRTVAVLGCGLAGIYPSENSGLADEIAAAGGAVVTQFPLGALPTKMHFPMRNRIISGLSLGVLVVEGEEDSGSLITAECALDQGRDVYAVPGPLDSDMSRGPLKLIQQGAKLVLGLEDILEELPKEAGRPPDKVPRKARAAAPDKPGPDALSGEEARLHSLLVEAGKLHLDQLATLSGVPAGRLSACVTLLELKGAVRQLPGSYLEPVPK